MFQQETEAQKVIAISLGKIAISRSQRGGPKLFKNLLVANVIQKARYVVLDETAHQYRDVAFSSIPSTNVSTSEELSLTDADAPVRSESSRDLTEVAQPAVDGMDLAEGCAWENDENNKENVLPNSENANDRICCNKSAFAGEKLYYSSGVPSRCVKRRSSTAEDMFSTKRARKNWRNRSSSVDSVPEIIEDDSNSNSLDVTGAAETYNDDQMDLEQISNLVSVFSSSFKGLVDNNNAKTTMGSGDLTGFYGEKSARRTLPDVAVAVCSKQAGSVFTIRQSSFETSSPPIVALTV